ncbi:MAG: rhomboid family intramembrane serine protease [Melioribacteraceae bacterium]|nr:rhomboid family intramembrane serine protease [Melioribacteraceae bacterium]MCF8354231.1 rhomboid family intramembrane serine protease [Melioribacteraceae bacterium]MCF8394738.1 rhomboid family intramembrane serine protease [Melioribacteraceae bacterium]MCF8417962.1 rhomboid family intramembrane serine protease [Melioribacteraceae bacterium]
MGLDGRDYYRPTGFGGFSVFPPVIKTLLIINVAVFFVQIIFENLSFGGVPGWYVLNRYFALNPIAGMDQAGQPFNFQIWQLISYQFMHSTGGFGHIFFNMLMLWMFGMELENMWGSKKFLLFYLISGIGAGIAHVFISPLFASGGAPTIGASGAVYGIMLAFAMFFPNRYIYIWFLLPVKAKYLIAFLILIEFMSVGGPSIVAHLAHLGGALTAFIMIMADKKYRIDVDRMYYNLKNKFQSYSSGETEYKFRKPKDISGDKEVIDAEFYEINERKNKSEEVTQEEIDRILDKISQSGYQNLTEKEKKVLFEASKKS